jgi:hypothetical protein
MGSYEAVNAETRAVEASKDAKRGDMNWARPIRKWFAVLSMLALAVLFAIAVYMGLRWPNMTHLFPSVAGLIFALVACYGLIRNHVWGRWIALATAISGLAFSLPFLLFGPTAAQSPRFWTVISLLSLLLFAQLWPNSEAERSPLCVQNGRAQLLVWALVLQLAAAPAVLYLAVLASHLSYVTSLAIGMLLSTALSFLLLLKQRAAALFALVAAGVFGMLGVDLAIGQLATMLPAPAAHTFGCGHAYGVYWLDVLRWTQGLAAALSSTLGGTLALVLLVGRLTSPAKIQH